MARRPTDPYASFNFLVETNGMLQAGFSEITGLNSETEIIEYRNGNEDITPRKLSSKTKQGNVSLKRGVAQGQDFLAWRKSVTDGQIVRQNISIVLLDESKTEVVRYNLANAWPCKWMGPDLKANASEVAIETLELCHEGVTLG